MIFETLYTTMFFCRAGNICEVFWCFRWWWMSWILYWHFCTVYSCPPILECPRIKACTLWDYYCCCCCCWWVQESFAFTELCSACSMPVSGLIWQLCMLYILWLYPCVDSHEVVLVSCCSMGHRISPALDWWKFHQEVNLGHCTLTARIHLR